MKYNTELPKLIIPEYGRHIHTMAQSLIDIDDKDKRNKQANILINIMGNLNNHLRDVEEYRYKLWEHLFIMTKHKLDIDSPFPKPNLEATKESIPPLKNIQGKVKYKHYGKLIMQLIAEWKDIKDEKIKKAILPNLAQQMKRSYMDFNQTNVQDSHIWREIESFSGESIEIDKDTIIPVFQTNPVRKKPFYKKTNRKHYSKK